MTVAVLVATAGAETAQDLHVSVRPALKLLVVSLGAAAAALALVSPARADLSAERDLAARYAPGGAARHPIGDAARAPPTCRSTSTSCSAADGLAARAVGNRPDRSLRPRAISARPVRAITSTFPGRAQPRLRLQASGSASFRAGRSRPSMPMLPPTGRPGKLALQYWLFYVFNDWNNPHEGDWEMIQLNFDAATAAEALQKRPSRSATASTRAPSVRLGRAEARGGRRHPSGRVSAAGSHANFFGQALYLGSPASQGVGCDDTRGADRDLRPVVETIPNDPGAAQAASPGSGSRADGASCSEPSSTGPTGPNLKDQWTEPITWSQGWRSRSYAIPAGGVLGHEDDRLLLRGGRGAAPSSCGGSSTSQCRQSCASLASSSACALPVSRDRWRPTAPLRPARRRPWGQIIAASGRMYDTDGAFRGYRLLLVPISAARLAAPGLVVQDV